MKKLLALLLTTLLLFSAVAFTASAWITEYTPAYSSGYGNINGDSVLNGFDYMLLKMYVLGRSKLANMQKCRADVNLDGTVDAMDCMLLKAILVGRAKSLNPGAGKSYAEMTDEELRMRLNKELMRPREEGMIAIGVESDSLEQVAELFAELGLSTEFENKEAYKAVWIGNSVVYLDMVCSESEIRELLFVLNRDERIRYAAPLLYELPD